MSVVERDRWVTVCGRCLVAISGGECCAIGFTPTTHCARCGEPYHIDGCVPLRQYPVRLGDVLHAPPLLLGPSTVRLFPSVRQPHPKDAPS